MRNQQVLYVSYDGMTDPLGQSQVLPYICGLADLGYRFTLLTSEKPERMKAVGGLIREICKKHNIDWVPLIFHTQPKLISKVYDVRCLKRKAVALYKSKKFEMVHCRSYVGVDVGLHLKRKYGVRVLFDMRGFWVDERVDGNMWNLKNPIYKYAFRYYKNKENNYVANADHIVSLTEAGKREVQKWKGYRNAEISVIPCSADFNVFTLLTKEEKQKARIALGLPEEGLVLSYLGSIGSWYLLPEMLSLFALTKEKYPEVKFLFVTSGNPDLILAEAEKIADKKRRYRNTFCFT
ncbi:MAG: glycosyltransferase [Chitinophagaceae bacterium]|nr:glycosyltransferase [Chitinophagaceae bacterium]